MGEEVHRFSKREYAISCMFTLLFSMLVSASYFDIATCPYNSRGGAALDAAHATPPKSIFDSAFTIVPCHTIDLLVWIYMVMLVFFLLYKWVTYKAQGFHYFLLDYCYFHNACLCALILSLVVRVEWTASLGGILYLPTGFDIVPVATVIGSLTTEKLSATTFIFFVILGGTFGPILGAILMWRNALLFHSFDRMTSCYLHLAPAAVQGMLVHAAMSSVKLRSTSKLRSFLKADVHFGTLLAMHFLMFAAWQVYYHVIHELRLWQRKRAFAQEIAKRQKDSATPLSPAPATESPTNKSETETMYRCMVLRTTAYTWMMEKPPMGKEGPLYRLATIFGTGRLQSTVMFSVVQAMIHTVFFVLGFVPIYLSFIVLESATPLLVYTCSYVLFCIYNAAAVNKSWIQKLQAKGKEADKLRAELTELRSSGCAKGAAQTTEEERVLKKSQ